MRSVCVFLCLAGTAGAQRSRAEETPLQCSDHLDNDGNGLVDCDDPKCSGVGQCRALFLEVEGEQKLTPTGQITAGVLMLVAGPAIAGASSAVYLDALKQHADSKRTVEFVMGGVMTAAGAVIAIAGAVVLNKGWRRHKEDVEMGLALGPTRAGLRITF